MLDKRIGVAVDSNGNYIDEVLDSNKNSFSNYTIIDVFPSNDAGLHAPKWDSVNKVWIEGKTTAELLVIAQTEKIAELQQSFGQAILAGFPSSVDGTPRTYAIDSIAMGKWTGTLALINSGGLTSSVAIKALDGTPVALTPTQFKQFAGDGFSYFNQQEANLWQKEVDVTTAVTNSDMTALQAIAW